VKAVIATIVCLVIISVLGVGLHMAFGIGWFTLNSSIIPPQDKADALRGLLESSSMKAAAYGTSAIVASVVYSFIARSSSMVAASIYAALAGACVAFNGNVDVVATSSGVGVFFVALVLHALIRRDAPAQEASAPNN
jgi:hypothetical protein